VAEPVLLITGAGGYLGRRLVRRAAVQGTVYAAVHRRSPAAEAQDEISLDVTDRGDVLRAFAALRPDVTIHAAAVNPGQGDEASMWRVNLDGSRNVAEASRAVGARLIAVSTDMVHAGRTAPYGDDAPPSPINGYGRSKSAAEAAILTTHPGSAVVRPSLIYGLDEMDRGTAGFARRIAAGEPQVLFSDVIRSPVWVETLAEALIRLAGLDYSGVLNVAGRQALSREDFGRRMLEYWGVDGGNLIRSGRAADTSASIPQDLRLVVDRAEELLAMEFPGVDNVLAARPGPQPGSAPTG